jgi:serine-type D-Ala-D-Ala carboxypeptidase (penicillin-binding protein 5/6)
MGRRSGQWVIVWVGIVGCLATITRPVLGGTQRTDAKPRGTQAVPGEEPYRAAILVDAASGAVLFEKDAHRQLPPASMTKMMLMLLVAERVRDGTMRWDDRVRVSAWASRIGGSQVYLKEGESFTLGEMMQAIAIHSANDAAVAVAEALAGSTDAFVRLMNQRANELEMRDTTYYSVHGLPPTRGQREDLSSASDLALLARQLVKFPDIVKWTGTKEAPFRNGTMTLTNTNRLVRETNWIDGLKTGYFGAAGFNVAATGQRDGLRLIAVVLGATEKQQCFGQAARLLNRGFGDYHAQVAVRQGETVASDVAVRGGHPRFVRVVAGGDISVLARRGEHRQFSLELALPTEVAAPLDANSAVGEVIVKEGETVVGRVPALTADPVEKSSLWDRLF